MHDDAPILLYDGLCGFCDASVQFILRHDRRGTLRFATLQGDYARALLARHPWLEEVDSMILVESIDGAEQVSVRSTGALRVAAHMGGAWPALRALLLMPRPLRDGAYRLIARTRNRIFGRRESCRLPSTAERSRFLQ